MGANSSKHSKLGGGRHVLSAHSAPPQQQASPAAQQSAAPQRSSTASQRNTAPPVSKLGGKAPAPNQPDARLAAAAAAERRLKEQQMRGTNSSNPKQGRLATQVAKQNAKATTGPQSREEERLVWD